MIKTIRWGATALVVLAVAACDRGAAPASPDAGGALPGAASSAPATERLDAEITGAGASFIYPLLARWSADYHRETGAQINYQSIGSGGGVAQIKAATVDFGSSDKPLPSDELAAAGLGQFPSAIGGVVPVVNVDGIAAGQLRLTGPVLADIFLGRIADWNDPALVALNPGVALPDAKINVVHRSDGSGTTFNFAHYLGKVSPAWQSEVGADSALKWPTGIGGKGNEGVAAFVKQVKGSIGYVELSYAIQTGLAHAQMQNAAGHWVQPNAASFQAAAASADWAGAKDFHLIITDAPGAGAWPITATNFMLMYKQPKDPARAKAALEFFRWALRSGQPQAEELHYVPLPPELVEQVEAYWASEFDFR